MVLKDLVYTIPAVVLVGAGLYWFHNSGELMPKPKGNLVSRTECNLPLEDGQILPVLFEKYDSGDNNKDTFDVFLYLEGKNVLVNQIKGDKGLIYMDLNLNGMSDIFPLELPVVSPKRNFVHHSDELMISKMCTQSMSL